MGNVSDVNNREDSFNNRRWQICQKMDVYRTTIFYCGVDIFGSFVVKDGWKEVKKYGVLYTCLSASRTIHIEVIPTQKLYMFCIQKLYKMYTTSVYKIYTKCLDKNHNIFQRMHFNHIMIFFNLID